MCPFCDAHLISTYQFSTTAIFAITITDASCYSVQDQHLHCFLHILAALQILILPATEPGALLGHARQSALRPDADSATAAFSSCQTEQQWKVGCEGSPGFSELNPTERN